MSFFFCLPAVDHNGPGILGVAILHFFEELEHADGGERHPEIWPAGEMELGDEPLRFLPRHVSHLRNSRTGLLTKPQQEESHPSFLLVASKLQNHVSF